MTLQEIKESLHKNIENIDDEEFLSSLNDFIEFGSQNDDFSLEDWEMDRIKYAEEQIASGEFYTHEQVKETLAQWRKK